MGRRIAGVYPTGDLTQIPQLLPFGLHSAEEWPALEAVNRGLADLLIFTDELAVWFGLFEEAEAAERAAFKERIADPSLFRIRQILAAQGAVMSTWHFGKAMAGMRVAIKQSETLGALVDQSALKDAHRLFNRYFREPMGDSEFRQAVAHAGERSTEVTPLKAPQPQRVLNGRRYAYMSARGAYVLTITSETVGLLVGVRETFYTAFKRAAEVLAQPRPGAR